MKIPPRFLSRRRASLSPLRRQPRRAALLLVLFAGLASGCPSDEPAPGNLSDVVVDATAETDSVSSGTCTPITLGSWSAESSDVSAATVANVTEQIGGESFVFRFLFERYGEPGTDMGTFDLSVEPDNNFGTCAHCVVASSEGTGGEPGTFYYVDRGSLDLRMDPYGRRFDFTATNLRLIEVTVDPITRSSTPVPGGGCLTLDTVVVDDRFPPSNWSCDKALYGDGDCHCDCSGGDPDCSSSLGQPAPEPVDCAADEVCTFDPVLFASSCKAGCDWKLKAPCPVGTCVYSNGAKAEGDTCINQSQQLDLANVGEACATGGNLQKYCALENGFSNGYCDDYGLCRAICETDAECTEADHSCRFFLPGQDSYGYCGPPPPIDG